MITHQQALLAARQRLLGPEAVTDGWDGRGVELVDGQLLVTFTWRRLPYLFAVRLDLDDLNEPVWTGGPAWTAQAWVDELVVRLMEECDTGAVAWLPRRERDGRVELLLGQPRLGQAPPGWLRAHYVNPTTTSVDGLVDREWIAYVHDESGSSALAHLVVTLDEGRAQLSPRELSADLPDALVAELAYLALFDAACQGAQLVTLGLDHPALELLGLERDGGRLTWRASGPLLTPPPLEPPVQPER